VLVIWRGVGQSIRIGDGLLTVESVRPSIRLSFQSATRTQRYLLRRSDQDAAIQLPSCRVVLIDSSSTEIRLGLDAPPEVQITRTELLPELEAPSATTET
jgi:sRNA-binding carbon storage regulator CsrA